ncbi:MAG: phosphocholine cytidylyltransferase family protein [Chlorobi bacterium]|nr:phosphocholine cytidylyltransferase family protein [Chlorobiota bacterium]MCI0716468.1 phosphocholine cytidylyltransferase family protein [Chlorobiota bacterium]
MQAIILAAGLSKRLRPITDYAPKCLLKVGGKTLLEMTINNILKNGLNEFVVVTGYREDMIKGFVSKNYPELSIKYITNRDYENNNNSYSLWMTKDYITGACILLDSDILFDYRIISKLLESKHADCLAVNTNHSLGEEEIKVIIDSRNKIKHIGKDLSPSESFGESIGIEKFSPVFFKELGEVLERKIVKENNVNEFYEALFQELYDKGNAMYAVDVSEYKSLEIDFPEDLIMAEEEIREIQF